MPYVTSSQGTMFVTGPNSAQYSVIRPRYDVAVPTDHNFAAWSHEPAADTGFTLVAGTVYASRVWIPKPFTIAGVAIGLQQSGTGATALANCFVGVYNAAGTRIGVSADLSASWAAAQGNGLRTHAVTVDGGQSLAVSGGENEYVYVARVIGTQATTPCQHLMRGLSGTPRFPNLGLLDTGGVALTFRAGAIPRSMVIATGAVALPASFAASPITAFSGGADLWAGLYTA